MSPSTGTNASMKNNVSGANKSDAGSIIPGITQDRIDGMKDKFSGVVEGFNGNVERVTGFIKERPMVTFATALGVGFLVGTLILRAKNRAGSYDTGSVQ